MNLLNELKSKGWYLTEEGLETLKEGLDNVTLSGVIQKALNTDLRDIGSNFFSEDVNKSKEDYINGPGVVQIQKVKNASAPKYEYSAGAPPILRLLLTDGNSYFNCLQWGYWKSINMDTPPGTKLYLKPGKIVMQNNFMLLSDHQFSVLGGTVASMVEKWELSKRLASHVRTKENLDSTGPPPWIPFGQPIVATKVKSGNFKALELDSKEQKEDAVFKQQRLANIAEVAKVKEGKQKVFGGGKDIKQANNNNKAESNSVPPSNDSSGYGRPQQQRNYDPDFRRRKDDERNSNRNERNFYPQDGHRNPPSFNNENSSQGYSNDRRADPRNKYNNNNKTQGSYQNHQRTSDNTFREHFDQANSNRRYQKGQQHFGDNPRASNADRYDRRSNDVEDVSQRTSQIKFHGYDTQHDVKSVPTKPFIKPGAEVMAKYWEDNKFYRATVHAVGKEGRTCVVHFMEYGNYEEVLIDDVQQLQQQQQQKTSNNFKQDWSVGPLSFQPSHWETYDRNQDFPPISNFQDSNSHKSFGNHQDRHRSSRQDFRPSAKLYQPPRQRQP